MHDPSINPKNGTSPSFSSLNPFCNAESSHALKKEAEQLYAYLTYVSLEPNKQKKCFEALTIMMYLGGSCLLKPEEEKRALAEIATLKDDLYGGVISYAAVDFQAHLQQIIQRIVEDNPRAKLLTLSMELEYLLVLHVPQGYDPIDSKDCERLLNPLRAKVYDEGFSNLHMVNLGKQIQSIKESLAEAPDMRNHHLERLEQSFKSF